MQDKEEKKVTNEKPVSLAGVDFKKLLQAFLKVKPEEDGGKEKLKKKPSYSLGFCKCVC